MQIFNHNQQRLTAGLAQLKHQGVCQQFSAVGFNLTAQVKKLLGAQRGTLQPDRDNEVLAKQAQVVVSSINFVPTYRAAGLARKIRSQCSLAGACPPIDDRGICRDQSLREQLQKPWPGCSESQCRNSDFVVNKVFVDRHNRCICPKIWPLPTARWTMLELLPTPLA